MASSLSCYLSGMVGIGMLGATFMTMSVNEEENNRFREVLSPDLVKVYNQIVIERRNLYFQGLILGLVISIFVLKSGIFRVTNMYHRATLFLAITIPISVIYYFLMPKSDYMLNHLKSSEENKGWLHIYRTMRQRYILGFVFGSLAAIPISHAFC